MARVIGIVSDHYRPVSNAEVLAFLASLYPDPDAGRCEHEDWDRMAVDWARCANPATVTVYDGVQDIRVCAEDAPLYEPIDT